MNPTNFSPTLYPNNRLIYIDKKSDLTRNQIIPSTGVCIDTLSAPINIWTKDNTNKAPVVGFNASKQWYTYLNNKPDGTVYTDTFNDTYTNYTQYIYTDFKYNTSGLFTNLYSNTSTSSNSIFTIASFNQLDGFILKSFIVDTSNFNGYTKADSSIHIVVNGYILDNPINFANNKEIIVNGPITIVISVKNSVNIELPESLSLNTVYYKVTPNSYVHNTTQYYTIAIPNVLLTNMYIYEVPNILYYDKSVNTYDYKSNSNTGNIIFVVYKKMNNKTCNNIVNYELNYYPYFLLEKLFRQYLDIYIAFYQNVVKSYYKSVNNRAWWITDGGQSNPNFLGSKILDVLSTFESYGNILSSYKCVYSSSAFTNISKSNFGAITNLYGSEGDTIKIPVGVGSGKGGTTPGGIVPATNLTELQTRFPVLYNMFISVIKQPGTVIDIINIYPLNANVVCPSPLLSPYNCLPDVIKGVLIEKSNLKPEGNRLQLANYEILKDFLEISGLRPESYPPNSPIKYFYLSQEIVFSRNKDNLFITKILSVLQDVVSKGYRNTYWGA